MLYLKFVFYFLKFYIFLNEVIILFHETADLLLFDIMIHKWSY